MLTEPGALDDDRVVVTRAGGIHRRYPELAAAALGELDGARACDPVSHTVALWAREAPSAAQAWVCAGSLWAWSGPGDRARAAAGAIEGVLGELAVRDGAQWRSEWTRWCVRDLVARCARWPGGDASESSGRWFIEPAQREHYLAGEAGEVPPWDRLVDELVDVLGGVGATVPAPARRDDLVGTMGLVWGEAPCEVPTVAAVWLQRCRGWSEVHADTAECELALGMDKVGLEALADVVGGSLGG